MRFAFFALVLTLLSVFSLRAGGPSIEVVGDVNAVETGKDYITFAIYGKARLFVYDVTWDDVPSGTSAKGVAFKFENTFLVIHRDQDPVPGFSTIWDETVKKALSLKSKRIFIQCWDSKAIIEGPSISRIDTNHVYFEENTK